MHAKPILYAEDEEADVFFMKRAFQQAGILNPLVVVPDGQLVMDYLTGFGPYSNRDQHPSPCLVLLDLNTPIHSGFEVLKWIRSQPPMCMLPVVVVTSSGQQSDIHRAYLLGTNSYLVKPSRPDGLVQMVKAIKDFWLTQDQAVLVGIQAEPT